MRLIIVKTMPYPALENMVPQTLDTKGRGIDAYHAAVLQSPFQFQTSSPSISMSSINIRVCSHRRRGPNGGLVEGTRVDSMDNRFSHE